MKDNKVFQLFITFLKIGAFTFGGGLAMIPLIQKEIVDNKKWLSEADVSDIVTISEMTPGPVAINAATFVGYKTKGFKGALAATVGVILPSFFIILCIAAFFWKYMSYEIVANAFWGVRIAVIGLMVKAFLTMFKQCPKNMVAYSIAAAGLVLVGVLNINAIFIILGAAFIGIIYQQVKTGAKK